jgi:hypothetical protein
MLPFSPRNPDESKKDFYFPIVVYRSFFVLLWHALQTHSRNMFIRVMTKINVSTNMQSYTTPYTSPVISGYCCKADKDFALLDYYVASSGSFRKTYQSHLQELDPRAVFKGQALEDGNNRF